MNWCLFLLPLLSLLSLPPLIYLLVLPLYLLSSLLLSLLSSHHTFHHTSHHHSTLLPLGEQDKGGERIACGAIYHRIHSRQVQRPREHIRLVCLCVCVCAPGWLAVGHPSHHFESLSMSYSITLGHLYCTVKFRFLVHTYTIDNCEFTANIRVFNRIRLDIPCDLVFPLSRHSNLKLTEQNVVSLSNNGCAGKYARVQL